MNDNPQNPPAQPPPSPGDAGLRLPKPHIQTTTTTPTAVTTTMPLESNVSGHSVSPTAVATPSSPTPTVNPPTTVNPPSFSPERFSNDATSPSNLHPTVNQPPLQSQPPTTLLSSNISSPTPPVNSASNIGGTDIGPETKAGNRRGPGLGVIIGLLSAIFVLITAGLFGAGVMVAYGRLSLPNQAWNNQVQAIVLSLPFMPKTPEYVLEAMARAHEQVATGHLEASLATQSKSIESLLNTQNFEMAVMGDFDARDPDQAKLAFNVRLTPEFDADLMMLENSMFVKVNQVPQVVTGMILGLAGEGVTLDPLLKQWVEIDMSELNTEAKEVLEENREEEGLSEEQQRFLDRLGEEVLAQKLKMKTEELEGENAYLMEIDLDGEAVDQIVAIYEEEMGKSTSPSALDTDEIRPSDVFKNITAKVWVLKESYYFRKATLFVRVDNSAYVSQFNSPDTMVGPMPLPEEEVVEVAATLNLTNVGEPVSITAPEEKMSVEEFTAKATELFMQIQNASSEVNGEIQEPPILGMIDEWVEVEEE